MSKTKMANSNLLDFEIVSSNEDMAVFKRIVSKKGKSPIQVKKIEQNMPTTTLHYFDKKDFEALKEIETKIFSQMSQVNDDKYSHKSSIMEYILKFLEIPKTTF